MLTVLILIITFRSERMQVMDLNKRSFKEGKIKENILQMLPITEDELIIVKK